MEETADHLAMVEALDNGKPLREIKTADVYLVIDHFRYFAGVIRSEEGTSQQLDKILEYVEIGKEEATIVKFKDEDEVTELANDSKYGLVGDVFTRDINKAFRLSLAVRTDGCGVNQLQTYLKMQHLMVIKIQVLVTSLIRI